MREAWSTVTWAEILNSERAITFLSGVAGAAALAITDFRGSWRLLQHVCVGTLASATATPVLFPAISKALSLIAVAPEAQEHSAAFLTGGFAIYLFEVMVQSLRRVKLIKDKKGEKDVND
jgi:hypothetical protein